MINAQDLWPLNSKGSLLCQTYRDMGHPFMLVIFEDPWHLMPSGKMLSCHYLFFFDIYVAARIQLPNRPLHVIESCYFQGRTEEIFKSSLKI